MPQKFAWSSKNPASNPVWLLSPAHQLRQFRGRGVESDAPGAPSFLLQTHHDFSPQKFTRLSHRNARSTDPTAIQVASHNALHKPSFVSTKGHHLLSTCGKSEISPTKTTLQYLSSNTLSHHVQLTLSIAPSFAARASDTHKASSLLQGPSKNTPMPDPTRHHGKLTSRNLHVQESQQRTRYKRAEAGVLLFPARKHLQACSSISRLGSHITPF